MKKGDYVLATKFNDGDPHDHWCVGFYDGKTRDGRHLVRDSNGQQFRLNGFRRCSKINEECGRLLISNINLIQCCDRSLWSWKKFYKRDLRNLQQELGDKTDDQN